MKFLSFAFNALVATAFAQEQNKYTYERLNRKDALVLVVDIQDGLFQLTRDTDPHLYKNSALAHAELGKTFDIPVILTTSTETGPTGPLFQEIADQYPEAPFIKREGEINAWDNAAFREAVTAANKTQIIIAGIATDVCTTFLALSLREAGYSVWANGEASGTYSTFVRDISNTRMEKAGIQVVSFFAIVGELMRDHRGDENGNYGAEKVNPCSPSSSPSLAYLLVDTTLPLETEQFPLSKPRHV
uniref:Isochorismatase-like domain-containing protein n=1 Tax=Bionectria ochroleuca TaxID=29856 RepID=A0A8H7KCV3_BIOOC